MSESFFDKISPKLKPMKLILAKGEALFLQGDQITNSYCVIEGKVKLIRSTIEGAPVVVHVAHSGEAIAEASLFSNAYHCSAVADAKTEIGYFKKSEILDYLEQNPVAMMDLLAIFARQVRDLRLINEIKNIHSAKERVLAFITSEMNANREVNFSISLKDIAHRIGLAHETFYRELKNLEKSAIIERNDGHIKLL